MKKLTTCENRIQDRDLVDEIVNLKEHISEREAIIYDLENQIAKLKEELYFIF